MAERVIVNDEEIPAEDWLTVDFPDIDEVWSADATIDPGGRVRLLNPEPATHYSWHAGRSAWDAFPRHQRCPQDVRLPHRQKSLGIDLFHRHPCSPGGVVN